jgi:hypothetical protein
MEYASVVFEKKRRQDNYPKGWERREQNAMRQEQKKVVSKRETRKTMNSHQNH